MLVFIRRHLPAMALLQSLLAAGGDALNSAAASLLVRLRTVLRVCGAYAICQRPGLRHLVRSGPFNSSETSITPNFLHIFFERFNRNERPAKTADNMLNRYCTIVGNMAKIPSCE